MLDKGIVKMQRFYLRSTHDELECLKYNRVFYYKKSLYSMSFVYLLIIFCAFVVVQSIRVGVIYEKFPKRQQK